LCTLQVFFDAARSVRQTATRLGVHENTIRYRLARIAELTGLDLATNADHQLAGQLATLVLRLEGVLPAPRAAVPSAA
jgi:DNA-binding PucR family transcriptional regulator